jgi:hypothetical protein
MGAPGSILSSNQITGEIPEDYGNGDIDTIDLSHKTQPPHWQPIVLVWHRQADDKDQYNELCDEILWSRFLCKQQVPFFVAHLSTPLQETTVVVVHKKPKKQHS